MSDSTIVRILRGVPLDKDYLNTLSWGSLHEQISYFESKQVSGLTGSYQRQTGVDDVVRFNAPIDDIIDCNYIMYQNNAQSSKWYFGFIDKLVHKNSDVTEVQFTVDWLQTYYFDFSVNPCFVEREHVSDDARGNHFVEEGLELGEYVITREHNTWSINGVETPINDVTMKYWLVFATNVMPVGDGTHYGQSFSLGDEIFLYKDPNQSLCGGYVYFGVPFTESGVKTLSLTFKSLSELGKIDGVISLFLVPEFFIEPINVTIVADMYPQLIQFNNQDIRIKCDFGDGNFIDGYQPRNNKLLTYPYCFIYGTNNQGQFNTYRYELFRTTLGLEEPTFIVKSGIGESMKPLCYPVFYKNHNFNYDEGISLPSYTQCTWSSDTYAAWLAQNGSQIAVNMGSSIASIGAGVVSGNPLLAISGVTGIASQLAQMHKAEIAPPSVNGNSGGTVLQAINHNWFSFYKKSITRDRARIIDDYFDMYGYKINRVKVPNIRTRPQWNYVKTHDVTLKGNIPTVADTVIKKCFNNGITFWRNPANVGNYNLANK